MCWKGSFFPLLSFNSLENEMVEEITPKTTPTFCTLCIYYRTTLESYSLFRCGTWCTVRIFMYAFLNVQNLLKLFKPWEYLIYFHWFAGTKPFGAVDCHVMYQINIIENYRYWVYSVNYECSYHPKRWFPFMIRCLDKSRWSCLQCTHHTICQYHDFCILLDEKITLASLTLSWIEFQIVWIFFLLSRSVCNFSRLCC